jgi:hypothetical protein
MERRTLLKQLVFASGALLLVPACISDKSQPGISLKKLRINNRQQQWLAALTETIIPETDKPGARTIGAHLFVLTMADDCFTNEQQQQFVNGLTAFEDAVKKNTGKSFDALDAAQKDVFLQDIEAGKADKSDLQFFYNSVKSLTIQAYTTSKYYLTNVQVYKLVPGTFKGCVPVKSVYAKN